MFDLPKMLQLPRQERIYPFLERDFEENKIIEQESAEAIRNNKSYTANLLNFEDFIFEPELSPYQSKEVQYKIKERFRDFHNYKNEIIREICDEYKLENSDKTD
jgi:hypothetical protein